MIVPSGASVLSVLCILAVVAPGRSTYLQNEGCRSGGCITQQGCVPRYSRSSTALYCQRCVIERCQTHVESTSPRQVCYHITSLASGQRLAAVEKYDRRLRQPRYASVVASDRTDVQGHDKWHLLVGPSNDYYIRNFRTGEYLRAYDNNFAYLAQGRPTDESFLFKPRLVQGAWTCVLLQSVCYGSYLYGERYSATSNYVRLTQDLQRCYQENLWSITSVYC